MNITLPCPTGFYCLNGTDDDGIPCPLGTYNPNYGIDSDSDCLACPAGQFCNDTGLSSPAGDCDAGYLCVSGAAHSGPTDGVNDLCPLGHYCLSGNLFLVNVGIFAMSALEAG